MPFKVPLDKVRRHTLMTQGIANKLPEIGSMDGNTDPKVWTKFFCPYVSHKAVWLPFEFDGTDEFFGLVCNPIPELGYFSLSELQRLQRRGLPLIERDMYWTPCKLSHAVQTEHISWRHPSLKTSSSMTRHEEALYQGLEPIIENLEVTIRGWGKLYPDRVGLDLAKRLLEYLEEGDLYNTQLIATKLDKLKPGFVDNRLWSILLNGRVLHTHSMHDDMPSPIHFRTSNMMVDPDIDRAYVYLKKHRGELLRKLIIKAISLPNLEDVADDLSSQTGKNPYQLQSDILTGLGIDHMPMAS